MTTTDHSPAAESFPDQYVFEFDTDTSTPDADVWVDETFTNAYNDERAYLEGDTYDAKEIIKFDWEETHHDFDGDSKRWVVDVDSLDILEAKLNEGGFSTDFAIDGEEADDPLDGDLERATMVAYRDDDIEVEYEKKTSDSTNTYSGYVVGSNGDRPEIRFRRHDDDHLMMLKHDKYGNPALFTSGSHAPFVGALERITLTPEDADVEVDR